MVTWAYLTYRTSSTTPLSTTLLRFPFITSSRFISWVHLLSSIFLRASPARGIIAPTSRATNLSTRSIPLSMTQTGYFVPSMQPSLSVSRPSSMCTAGSSSWRTIVTKSQWVKSKAQKRSLCNKLRRPRAKPRLIKLVRTRKDKRRRNKTEVHWDCF